jgi:23S rRNA (adenine2030-N6)-methyltransferase
VNYHHIFHAGNFADIFKHLILCLCLEKMHEKPTPFFVLDTHAGAGKYDLEDERSKKTNESSEGIRKILSTKKIDFLPKKYYEILAKINCCEINELPIKARLYAGSPVIIKNFLRQQDRAIFAEKNQETFLQLKRNFAGNKKISTIKDDGFSLLKSKLPPLEKRGLILIDPAFEKDQSKISADYQKIIDGLIESKKRFSHGIYLVWHPIIEGEEVLLKEFYQKIFDLNLPKTIHQIFSLDNSKNENSKKMKSCGMFIINSPWQLEEKIETIKNKLSQIF